MRRAGASLFQCLRVEPCIYYLCIIICINNPPLKVCFLCRRATNILVVMRVHCDYFALKPIWAFKHPLLWLNLPILWSSCFCACSLNSVQRWSGVSVVSATKLCSERVSRFIISTPRPKSQKKLGKSGSDDQNGCVNLNRQGGLGIVWRMSGCLGSSMQTM